MPAMAPQSSGFGMPIRYMARVVTAPRAMLIKLVVAKKRASRVSTSLKMRKTRSLVSRVEKARMAEALKSFL